ncbi:MULTISPECIES: ornithine cyclodeaminase [unclassified Roseateles]|uniref:ornithine cyclodeaminase n=1 Tax=unclassified Roseateles TaxID=2626991 RepID=UPI0006F46AF8|nr:MULTISPECIES: ornithine cyclodeaminase [unclassified Roseateles]KQW52235.1 ornithine cyclodeaminase [Pelomonas sp. Root405]KRA78469.1 ornithine cyclodeaminase [Pelomonas sp. Root662]
MTTVLTTQDVARLVQRVGLPDLLRRLVDYLEADYLRWAEFDKTPRVAAHSPDGVIELMPIADASLYSFKYVNGHPRNYRFGLPTVMAFGVLADVDTGAPVLLSELTLTTAMRTAATSVMVAKRLARPDSRVMALIGNGAQSEFQALAFHHLLGIRELRLYDIDAAATAKLARHLGSTPGLTLTVCASTAEAVKGADIVTTVTADKTNATIITPDMIEPGMHINGVGGDCPGKTELHRGVMEMARVICEFEPQSRIEGDMQQMPADFPVTEFWRVLAGQAAGRESSSQVTVFDSVGFALEDFSALRLLRDMSQQLGLGSPLDLIPQMADPKDLFGELQLSAQLQAA